MAGLKRPRQKFLCENGQEQAAAGRPRASDAGGCLGDLSLHDGRDDPQRPLTANGQVAMSVSNTRLRSRTQLQPGAAYQ